MKVKIKVEPLGDVGATPKGFIRQFIALDATGCKSVIKVFSKSIEKLQVASGAEMLVTPQDFCFAE